MSLRTFWRDQRGGIAPFMVLGIAGVMFAGAYAFDATRMTTGAAQLKRATDAAALAVTMEAAGKADMDQALLNQMAQEFVYTNLGMDSTLDKNRVTDIAVTRAGGMDASVYRYTVSARMQALSTLLRAGEQSLVVASTAEVISQPTEVAIAIHTGDIPFSQDEFRAVKQQTKEFVTTLFGMESELDAGRPNMYVSIVPFMGQINVWDEKDPLRLMRWAAGAAALKPVYLNSLWNAGDKNPSITNLADSRAPDRRLNLLCMYRAQGTTAVRYDLWDNSAAGRLMLYYNDYELNDPGWPQPKVTWTGRHPALPNDPSIDQRALHSDSRCPHDRVLPLSDKPAEVLERIDSLGNQGLRHAATVYRNGLSWAAATLSPQMRGETGWGNSRLPHDYEPEINRKALVFVASALSDYEAFDGANSAEIRTLCNSIRGRDISVYFVLVRSRFSPSGTGNASMIQFNVLANLFRRNCIKDPEDFIMLSIPGLANSNAPELGAAFRQVADKINSQYSSPRLVE